MAEDYARGRLPLIQQFLNFNLGLMTGEKLLATHPTVRDILEDCDSIETAAVFASMLLDERLQSNCVRLEALVHLAITGCGGTKSLSSNELAACFNELGQGICGRMEDPAEDVFVSIITTSIGEFRVLEGTWECGTFYLQRVVNILERLPPGNLFDKLRRQVFALLKLSELMCKNAGLVRYTVGQTAPSAEIDNSFYRIENASLVRFSEEDLARLEIVPGDLTPFTLPEEWKQCVGREPTIQSPLQQCLIVRSNNAYVCMLPTAVSRAIRVAVIGTLLRQRLEEPLVEQIAIEYGHLFGIRGLIGGAPREALHFDEADGLLLSECMKRTDRGLFTHFVFFTDTLVDFEREFPGVFHLTEPQCKALENLITSAAEELRAIPEFRGGTTVVAYCGIGRNVQMRKLTIDDEKWRIEAMSAADLSTLADFRPMDDLKFWKILDNIQRAKEQGLVSMRNSLLTLISSVYANGGQVIDHSEVPRQFRRTGGHFNLDPRYVLEMRHQVAVESDVRCVLSPQGRVTLVKLASNSLFSEDRARPIYRPIEAAPGQQLSCIYLSESRTWWCDIPGSDDLDMDIENAETIRTWIPKIVPKLEERLGEQIPNYVHLLFDFGELPTEEIKTRFNDKESVLDQIRIAVDMENSKVSIELGRGFHMGLANPINLAERALVSAVCRGVCEVSAVVNNSDEIVELEQLIVRNDDARQRHMIYARNARQFLVDQLPSKLVRIDEQDVAFLRTGLVFRVESRFQGRSTVRTKNTCKALLNALVRKLEEEICDELKEFDRASMIGMLLVNYEKAMSDRDHWKRTARANLGLHDNKDETLEVIVEHELEMSAILLACRILIEFSICESSLKSGRVPSSIELSRLMVKANAIFELGGWSDAIHLDAMKPQLEITALGDVRAEMDFRSQILNPFAEKGGQVRILEAVDTYEDSFREAEIHSGDDRFVREFDDAWSGEFGFEIVELLKFLDAIEDLGIRNGHPVIRIRRGVLISELKEELPPSVTERVIDAFTLAPRPSWRTIPNELRDKDIQPWVFRRELSATRRPIYQIDDSKDPELIFAPAGIRESVALVVAGYYEGSYRDWQYQTPGMKKWIGARTNQRGTEFAVRVAERVAELGWTTAKPELLISEILARSSDAEFGNVKQFGDVDVLAWDLDKGRLLVIECKDLHFHKTLGEIAEQLSDYRGELNRKGKPDDLLKHLRRVEFLSARKDEVCKFLKIPNDVRLEGWVVFKNPVPMAYAWDALRTKSHMTIFGELEGSLDCITDANSTIS